MRKYKNFILAIITIAVIFGLYSFKDSFAAVKIFKIKPSQMQKLGGLVISGSAPAPSGDYIKPQSSKEEQFSTETITANKSATSTDTYTVSKYRIYKFDTPYDAQGSCLILKQTDGGYLYLTASAGKLITSLTGCGQ